MSVLDKKVALVTGGGQGVGAGIALALAAEGAAVAVLEVQDDQGRELASYRTINTGQVVKLDQRIRYFENLL